MNDKINLPEMVSKETYLGLAPQKQEEYVGKKLKELLELNANTGVTIPEIEVDTPFTRPTIIKHLERMISSRQIYKIKRGALTVYYPNGKIEHPELMLEVSSDLGTKFRGSFLNNNFGKFLFIEDLTKNISGGSMLIKINDVKTFREFVNKLADRGEKLEKS